MKITLNVETIGDQCWVTFICNDRLVSGHLRMTESEIQALVERLGLIGRVSASPSVQIYVEV